MSGRCRQQVDREQVDQVDCSNVEVPVHYRKTTILDSSLKTIKASSFIFTVESVKTMLLKDDKLLLLS